MSPLETPGDANQLRYKALGTNLDDNYTDIHIRTYIFSTTHKGKKKKKKKNKKNKNIPACNLLIVLWKIFYIFK